LSDIRLTLTVIFFILFGLNRLSTEFAKDKYPGFISFLKKPIAIYFNVIIASTGFSIRLIVSFVLVCIFYIKF